ncbi:MAG: diguanylate cyclase [Acidobacteriota bacterium]|nr:diguanylate cyclase [Acidobacteriota bacterium]
MEPSGTAVMVIDGNRVSRKVNAKLLGGHCGPRAKILEVESGGDGLYFCENQVITLILMEYHLPDMDCPAFLEKLRSQPRGDQIPVIVLSAEGDEDHAVATIKAGARDFLIKGRFSTEKLCNSIDRALEEARLKKQVEREREERQRAEANVHLFRDLINQTVDILFIADPDTGMLLDFNDSAWRNLGYTSEQLKQVTVRDFLVGFQKPSAWNDLQSKARKYDHWTHEGEIMRKDEITYPVEVTIRTITRGANQYMVGVARDITTRKKIEAQLRDLSNRDGLTGIHNRRYLDETLESEWNRQRRHGNPVSLIMIDVDFFKRYNDTYGHQAGDQCLVAIGKLMMDQFRRSTDLTARYGGEEFTVVLPNTEPAEARNAAESFRQAVLELGIPHMASDCEDRITVSLGMACMVPDRSNQPQNLIEEADKALYRAKAGGRNRLEVTSFFSGCP